MASRWCSERKNKMQFEEHYGRGAATMLSAPHVKILFRCNEPESARWVADLIGEEEKERPRIGTTATVDANGRDSINYSTFTERRSVVSREQIMGLRNLHGYWKYSDAVVSFRMEAQERPVVAHRFTPRTERESAQESRFPSAVPVTEDPPERERGAPTISSRGRTSEVSDELDLEF